MSDPADTAPGEPEPLDPTPAPRPEGHVVIVGAGRVGRDLAQRLEDVVVVEPDPERVLEVRQEAPEVRIVEGSGDDETALREAHVDEASGVVVVTSDDATNLRCVEAVRRCTDQRVLVRVEDPRNKDRFDPHDVVPVTGPLAHAPAMIFNLLRPGRRSLHEVILTDKSPAAGCRVDELDLPKDAQIVSLLRGDHLRVPEDGLVLEPGDVLTLVSPESQVADALNALTAAGESINPLERVYALARHEDDLDDPFREALAMAAPARAQVVAVGYDDRPEVLAHAHRLAEEASVDLDTRSIPLDADPVRALVRIVVDDHEEAGASQALRMELVVVDAETAAPLGNLLRRGPLLEVLEEMDHPVLVSRGGHPIEDVLVLLDSSSRGRNTVGASIDLALLHGADLTALLVEDHETEPQDRILQYLERVGRIHGIDVAARHVEGHPILEFLATSRRLDPDLVIIPWGSPTLRLDLLKRFVERCRGSVLLVP